MSNSNLHAGRTLAIAAVCALVLASCGGGGAGSPAAPGPGPAPAPGPGPAPAPAPGPAPAPAPPPASEAPLFLGVDRNTSATPGGSTSGFARLVMFRADGTTARTAHSFGLGATSSGFWWHILTARRTNTPGLYSDHRVRSLWLVDGGAVRYLDLDQPALGSRRVSTLRLDTPQTAFCDLRVMGSRDITDPLTSRALVSQAGQDARCGTPDDASFLLRASQTEASAPLPAPALAYRGAMQPLEKLDDRASRQDWLVWLADGRIVLLNEDLDTRSPIAVLGSVPPSPSASLSVVQASYPSARFVLKIEGAPPGLQLMHGDLVARSARLYGVGAGSLTSGLSDISPDAAGSYVITEGALGYWSASATMPTPLAGLAGDVAARVLVPINNGVIAIGRSRISGNETALLITQSAVTPITAGSAQFWYAYPEGNLITILGERDGQVILWVYDRNGSQIRQVAVGDLMDLVGRDGTLDFRTYGSPSSMLFLGSQSSQATDLISLNLSSGSEVRLGSWPGAIGFPDVRVVSATRTGRVQTLRVVRRTTDAQGVVRHVEDTVLVDLETPGSLRRLTNNISP